MSAHTEQIRADLRDILPKAAHSKIDEIIQYFIEMEPVREVSVNGARVPIEYREAYGLRVGVDGNGRAATVIFPYGAAIEAGGAVPDA